MEVINYHSNEGFRSGILVKTGNKFFSVLLMDNPLRIQRIPLSDQKHIRPVEYKGKPYPLARAKRRFREAAKRFHGGLRGCSKKVREALR